MTIAIISHPDCYKHDMGHEHPESPARLSAIEKALKSSNFLPSLRYYDAPLATYEQLIRAHSPHYPEQLEALAPETPESVCWLDGDTALMLHTMPAALRAAGAAIMAVDLVLGNKVQAAFCPIRPPGHHAKKARAMGFCYYSNVAIAAMHALEQHGLKRVAIVDFDVHHGNGTEDIVSGNNSIMLFSSFQHPFYPHEGANSKAANVCNLPLPAYTNGQTYRPEVEMRWLERLDAFKPQLIIFSAGFDGHAKDMMSQFQLVEDDYAWLTQQVKAIADRHCAGKIVSCLEGGYNLSALSTSVVAHVAAIIGI